MDDTCAGFDDRDAGVLTHEADQSRAAARNHHVDVTHGVEQGGDGVVPRRQQRESRLVDPFAEERFAEQGGDGLVGMAGVAASLQDAGVARLQAEREDVGRDVGPCFADHAYHAERYADLAQGHAVGAGPLGERLALRRGKPGDGFHVGGDRGDAFGRQPQAVAHGRIGGHGLQVEGVGREQFSGVFPQQSGGPDDCTSEALGVGPCKLGPGTAGSGEDCIVFHVIPGRGNRSESVV